MVHAFGLASFLLLQPAIASAAPLSTQRKLAAVLTYNRGPTIKRTESGQIKSPFSSVLTPPTAPTAVGTGIGIGGGGFSGGAGNFLMSDGDVCSGGSNNAESNGFQLIYMPDAASAAPSYGATPDQQFQYAMAYPWYNEQQSYGFAGQYYGGGGVYSGDQSHYGQSGAVYAGGGPRYSGQAVYDDSVSSVATQSTTTIVPLVLAAADNNGCESKCGGRGRLFELLHRKFGNRRGCSKNGGCLGTGGLGRGCAACSGDTDPLLKVIRVEDWS